MCIKTGSSALSMHPKSLILVFFLLPLTICIQQAGGNQAVVAYISTGIAFVTFQIKGSALSKKLCCKTNEQRPDNQHAEAPVPIPDPQARPLIAPSTTYVHGLWSQSIS